MPVDAAVADIERTGNIHDGGLGQPEAAQHVLGDVENLLRRQNQGLVHARTVCFSLLAG
jgi:ethanolamine ammonia-lyase small subunit